MNENEILSGKIEQVADVQADVGTVENVIDTADGVKSDLVVQSPEDNARFAETRRKEQLEEKTRLLAELENRVILEQEKNSYFEKALSAIGYNGSPQEVYDQIEAEKRGVPVETVRHERESVRQASVQEAKTKQELDFYKEQYNKSIIDKDIKAIRSKYSDVEVLEDLPDGFLEIMATGKIKDPVKAYEMLLPQKQTPPSSGSVQSTQTIDKDFYTEKEVDSLTSKELDNPKILEAVMKSMSRWK